MTAITIKDGNGTIKYLDATGEGTAISPYTTEKDLMLEIAAGRSTCRSAVHKFGANTDVTKETTEDVLDRGGTYIYPSKANMTHLSQDVDQAALRGQNVEIKGLDANWDEVVQIVVLNATNTTTAVALSTPLIRVNTMQVQAGAIGTSNIRLHNVGDTISYSQITPTNNRTLQTHYSVARNKTAYMTNVYGDVVESTGKEPKSTEFNLLIANRKNGWDFQLASARGVPKAGAAAQHSFAPYLTISEMSDIKITAHCSSEDGHVHAGFDLIVDEN